MAEHGSLLGAHALLWELKLKLEKKRGWAGQSRRLEAGFPQRLLGRCQRANVRGETRQKVAGDRHVTRRYLVVRIPGGNPFVTSPTHAADRAATAVPTQADEAGSEIEDYLRATRTKEKRRPLLDRLETRLEGCARSR
ncbi:MAG: hypothetical protein KKC18_10620 [Chloroflexi bacterium]|nr:hypothetical protein [Chloroflexota bacterium]